MTKVLIVAYYWPPSGGAGVQRWLKFVKYLPQFGVQPVVVTVNPEYASYAVTDESLIADVAAGVEVHRTQSREPFGAYKKISANKQIPQAGFANEKNAGFIEKLARFIRGNFFIPDARKGWNNYAFAKCCEIIEREKIDAIVTTSPPHSTQLIGLRLKQKYGLRWIADLRDPWTDIYYYNKLYHTPIAKRIDLKYERSVIEKADKVVVVSKAIKRTFENKGYTIAADKIAVIPNGYDHTDFENIVQATNTNFVITYTGTLSNDYPITGFIDVLAELIAEGNDITLRFFGSLPGDIAQLATTKLGNKVEINSHVTHTQAIEKMQSSDALLLLIPDVPGNEGILTGKLFEYLASHKPIIGIGPENGDAAEIINDCNVGKMVDSASKEGLKLYVQNLITQKAAGKPQAINTEMVSGFSRLALTKKMSSVISA